MSNGRTTADSLLSVGPPSSLSGWLSGDVSLAQRLQLQQQQHYHQHLQPASPSRLSVSAGVSSSPASPKLTPAARQHQQSLLCQDQQQPVESAAASSNKPAGEGSDGSGVKTEQALTSVYVPTSSGLLTNSPTAAVQGDSWQPVAVPSSLAGGIPQVISNLGSVPQQGRDTSWEAVEQLSQAEDNCCCEEPPGQPSNLLASTAAAAAQARVVNEQQELIRRFRKFKKKMLQLSDNPAGSSSSSSNSTGEADGGELLPPLDPGTGWEGEVDCVDNICVI
jgi:hypothetical protein